MFLSSISLKIFYMVKLLELSLYKLNATCIYERMLKQPTYKNTWQVVSWFVGSTTELNAGMWLSKIFFD